VGRRPLWSPLNRGQRDPVILGQPAQGIAIRKARPCVCKGFGDDQQDAAPQSPETLGGAGRGKCGMVHLLANGYCMERHRGSDPGIAGSDACQLKPGPFLDGHPMQHLATSTPKVKGKKAMVLDGNGKTRRKIIGGKKLCPACGKMLPLESFPIGSGQCATDRKIIQNITYAAKAQGKSEWFAEQLRDPAKLKKVVAAYKSQCFDDPIVLNGR
jgi:hypothetical protein